MKGIRIILVFLFVILIICAFTTNYNFGKSKKTTTNIIGYNSFTKMNISNGFLIGPIINNDEEILLGDTCTTCSSGTLTNGQCVTKSGPTGQPQNSCTGSNQNWENGGCYNVTRTNPTCSSCDAGKYLSSGTCYSCSAGYYSTAGSTSCTACSEGYYSSSSGSSSCTACSAGYYSSSTHSTSCTACSAGYYSSSTASTSCTACSAGYYSSSAGSTDCTACPAGKYNTASASTGCSNCSAGYTSAVASTSASACTACPAGKYNGTAGEDCKNCSAGTYSSSAGSTSCSTCSAGTYSSAGASSCTTCATDYISAAGASECTACAEGYTNNSNHTKCVIVCTAGFYPNDAGDTCVKCEKGYYCPDGKQRIACQYNTYTDAEQQTECAKCGVDKVKDDHTGCLECKVSMIKDYSHVSPSEIVTLTASFTNCATAATASFTASGGTVTKSGGAINFTAGSAQNATLKATKECSNMSATVTISNDGKSKSASSGNIVVVKEWNNQVCADGCISTKNYDVGSASIANKNGLDEYGYNKEEKSDANGTYYVYDKIGSRSCSPSGGISKPHTYCCVDNELPGLSETVFSVTKVRSVDCDYYAKKYNKSAATYTALESTTTGGSFNMNKCVAPPPVPGTCKEPTTLTPVGTEKNTAKCEDRLSFKVEDTQECTNTDNVNNRSFYRIKCTKTVDANFDYENDGIILNPSNLNKGEGLGFGIDVNTSVSCEYRFYETVWQEVFDKFLTKIDLIDEHLTAFARNNQPAKWKKYIDDNYPNKLSETNVRTLYDLWNTIDDLKKTVEDYNKYMPSNNYDENVNLSITTKEDGKDVEVTGSFDRNVIDEGTFSKSNVVEIPLNLPGLTNPKNYDTSNSSNPRVVKLLPKKVCINKVTGESTFAGADGKCKGVEIKGGNKIYIGYDTDPGEYDVKITLTGLGTNDSHIVNNWCKINVLKEEISYRPIDLVVPFINDKWEKGQNWVNDMYDFVSTIHKNTWAEKTQKVIDISKEEVSQIQSETAGYLKSGDSPYMGMCELIPNTNKDVVCEKVY